MNAKTAAALAAAIGTLATFALSKVVDLDDQQAIGSAITTIVSTLIALFIPAPGKAQDGLTVSPRTQKDVPVEQPKVIVEDVKDA